MSLNREQEQWAHELIGSALEELRGQLFKAEVREDYKFTFIARHPEQPELDIVVTEDDKAGLAALVARRLP